MGRTRPREPRSDGGRWMRGSLSGRGVSTPCSLQHPLPGPPGLGWTPQWWVLPPTPTVPSLASVDGWKHVSLQLLPLRSFSFLPDFPRLTSQCRFSDPDSGFFTFTHKQLLNLVVSMLVSCHWNPKKPVGPQNYLIPFPHRGGHSEPEKLREPPVPQQIPD